MELIAGDDRVVGLAHLADLGDDGADLIMYLHRFADGGVGGIHAVGLGQPVQYPQAHLLHIGVQGIVGDLVGNVAVGDEEIGLFVDFENLKVLHGSVHHGAGVNTDHGVQELIAALNASLNQSPGVLAGVVGHVVGGDIDGAGVGGAQTNREAVVYIEQDLRNVVAGITQGQLAVGLGLLHQFVVGILKQTLKVDQMLKIFQMLHLFFKEFLFFGAPPALP